MTSLATRFGTLLTALVASAGAAAAPAIAQTGTPAGASAPSAANAASSANAGTQVREAPLDYSTLSHAVSIEFLRAGSHDPSGVNEYYFNAKMLGLLNSAEERNTEIGKRKQVAVELGSFGDTSIDSLAYWRPDEKTGQVKEIKVEGDAIRELAARVMQDFGVQEGDVTVMVTISLYEKAKKWLFFGDDTYVGRAEYFPIPQSKFDTPLRTDSTLAVADDKGTLVKIRVHYEQPMTRAGP